MFGTPAEVYLAMGLAKRLRDKIGDESVRYIARKTGVSAQTILNILHGKTWPDLYTIARLEIGFDARLLGFEHRKRRPVNPRL